MIINVSRIPVGGEQITGDEDEAILELGQEGLVRPAGPVHYDVHAEKAGHELIVRGRLAVPLSVECSRCADFFSTRLEVSSFLRAYSVPEGTEMVDLTGDIREDILLSLPVSPLCSPGCKGLCPQCGKNLNQGPCACKPKPDARGTWSALDKLEL